MYLRINLQDFCKYTLTVPSWSIVFHCIPPPKVLKVLKRTRSLYVLILAKGELHAESLGGSQKTSIFYEESQKYSIFY